MYPEPKFTTAGDRAISVELGDTISSDTNMRVHNLAAAIESQNLPYIVDLIPAYRSILVQYKPQLISFDSLKTVLVSLADRSANSKPKQTQTVEVPTIYGGEYGPDLEFVAEYNGISKAEVIDLHCDNDYPVYMLGFTPGFPYLGGLSEKLHTPRLDTPRGSIPQGSVGIADSQTGIYPIESPGGWRIIGITPLKLFEPERETVSLLTQGDVVRFVPVREEDVAHLND